MARTVKEVALGTRAARAKLRPQRKPHWRTVEHGLHLGFYKPDGVGRVGSWVARRYIGDQRYETQTLGPRR